MRPVFNHQNHSHQEPSCIPSHRKSDLPQPRQPELELLELRRAWDHDHVADHVLRITARDPPPLTRSVSGAGTPSPDGQTEVWTT